MLGYKIINLLDLVEECGEDSAKEILSTFSCPLNQDVENFLKSKAITFARQGWSQTHLVFTSYKNSPVLVGYFTLASKLITIRVKNITSSLRRRLNKFATYNDDIKGYVLSAPLIAQLGKNYTNNYNDLIAGDELLQEACRKIYKIQYDLGGRFTYLECEDKDCLKEFYSRNGFCIFDRRNLDKDETDCLQGEYLLQLLKYIHKEDMN